MPRFNGRGPMGADARKGRGGGPCGTAQQDETISFEGKRIPGGDGRGNGRGGGARRGRRNRFFLRNQENTLNPGESFSKFPSASRDIKDLEEKLEATQESLRHLTERLDAMVPSVKEESES